MKNITLSADEDLIEQARQVARARRTTLNAAFREWLQNFTAQSGDAEQFDALLRRLRHVNAGRHFTRDEMNER
jgi:predicted transcriptional regulator